MSHPSTFFMEETVPAFIIMTAFELGLVYEEVWE